MKKEFNVGDTSVLANYITDLLPKQSAGVGGGLGMGDFDLQNIHRKFLNISYGNKSQSETLNIYLPNTTSNQYPVIFAIHGGGFKFGNNTASDLKAQMSALNHGFAVVTVNYRLSGEATFPAAINDVKAAIRLVRKDAAKYGLDPNRFILWGDSSGANLAALAGATGGSDQLYDSELGYLDISDKVSAVIDYYGPIDFGNISSEFKSLGITPMMNIEDENSFESLYLGAPINGDSSLVRQSNPVSYLKANDSTKYFIIAGDSDVNVPYLQSINFAAELNCKVGEESFSLNLIKGATHGSYQFESVEALSLVYQFIQNKVGWKVKSINKDDRDYILIN